MEKLETEVMKKEAVFINNVQIILSETCSDRIKIAKLYHSYIDCMANINTTISEAKLDP